MDLRREYEALAMDEWGQAWVGMEAGVELYRGPQGILFPVTGAEQGIPRQVIRTRDGRIWLVRSDRLVMFHPEGP